MNKSAITSRLGIKVTIIASVALAVTLGIYLLIFEVAVPEYLYGERFSDYWAKKETVALEDYRAYVAENKLTMRAAVQDVNWEKNYHTMFLYAERFDPASEEWYGPEAYAEHEVQCSDGVIYAFVYPSDGYYYNIGRIMGLCIAVFCFFLILLPYIYRIVHRITQLSKDMEILAGGDLSYKIISTGRDELAELGRDIEGMRCSVLEQMARENESILANSQLITSLSHDLRTPLTKLTGYLEILQHKKYSGIDEHDLYLSKALEKARQMQSLSDEMFRNFQVKKADYIGAKINSLESISFAEMLELIADQGCDLQAEGFQVTIPDNTGYGSVQIGKKDFQRILDNLFSNLKKYADKEHLISISVNNSPDFLNVSFENYIATQTSADSKGIGLPTVQSLLSKNGGHIEVDQTDNTFTIRLFLKKLK